MILDEENRKALLIAAVRANPKVGNDSQSSVNEYDDSRLWELIQECMTIEDALVKCHKVEDLQVDEEDEKASCDDDFRTFPAHNIWKQQQGDLDGRS